MRRRIVGLTVLAAVLSTALFGIPLAAAAARYFVADEHNELEHIADTVALAASGDLMRSRDPGPGAWVTIYANGGHVFMTVAGLRFDTSGRSQTGSRWQSDMRSPRGYTIRHPVGL